MTGAATLPAFASDGCHAYNRPVILRPPTSADAPQWFDFLVSQQAIAYTGIVPDDFADRQDGQRDDFLVELEGKFAEPGTARRIVAEADGAIVGLASIVDGPASWEEALGYVPSPAPRELARLYVSPAFHGTGLADELLAEIDRGEDLYLWLIDGNERAHRFYQRRGFVDCDEAFRAGPAWGNVSMHRMKRVAP